MRYIEVLSKNINLKNLNFRLLSRFFKELPFRPKLFNFLLFGFVSEKRVSQQKRRFKRNKRWRIYEAALK